jgi:hypothetical protein
MLLSNLYLLEALDPVANAIAKFSKNAVNIAKKVHDNYPNLDYEDLAKQLLQQTIETDPDPKKKSVGWILKQVGNKAIILPDDAHAINELLRRFIEQKRVGRLPEPDLNKHTVDSARDMLDQLGEVESKRQGGLGFDPSKMPGVEIYARGGPYVILRSTNAESLAEIGEGSIWCTRKSYGTQSLAPSYLKRFGAIYTIFKDGKQFVQYTPNYKEIQPARSTSRFIPPKELAKLMAPDPDILSGKIQGTSLNLIDVRSNYSALLGIPDLEAEKALLSELKTAEPDDNRSSAKGSVSASIHHCSHYISKFGDEIPFVKEFLDTIRSVHPQAIDQALKSLIDRVGDREEIPNALINTIADTHDSEAAVRLAETTKKRWPQFEKYWLFENLDNAIGYVAATAMVVPGLLNRIVKEGTIAQMLKYSIPLHKAGSLDVATLDRILSTKINDQADVKLISKFAEEVGTTPQIAHRIMTSQNPGFIVAYCSAVGKALPGSDEEIVRLGEAGSVWRWMRFRRKYDWPEAESILARDERYARLYMRITGRKPRIEGEERDVKPKTSKEALNFALATGDEYPEGEDLILQDLDVAIAYANQVIGPWSELEQKLRERGTPEQKKKYIDEVLYGIVLDELD